MTCTADLIGHVGPDVRQLPQFRFLALAPPVPFDADAFRLEDEALGLHQVKEELADEVRCCRTRHLQARPKPPVAGAVAEREGAEVEAAVALGHGQDVPLALVVLAAAAVRLELHPQLVEGPGAVARPAPLRAGGYEGVLPAGFFTICQVILVFRFLVSGPLVLLVFPVPRRSPYPNMTNICRTTVFPGFRKVGSLRNTLQFGALGGLAYQGFPGTGV